MTGDTLKTILLTIDSSLASVARRLNVSTQHLNSLFKVKDVKSGYIEKLSKIYGISIGYFYGEAAMRITANGERSIAAMNISTVENGDNERVISAVQRLESELKAEREINEQLRLRLSEKDDYIKLLKERYG